jgi:hypothetical protein
MGLVLHIFFVAVDKIFITNLRFEIWGWGNTDVSNNWMVKLSYTFNFNSLFQWFNL